MLCEVEATTTMLFCRRKKLTDIFCNEKSEYLKRIRNLRRSFSHRSGREREEHFFLLLLLSSLLSDCLHMQTCLRRHS